MENELRILMVEDVPADAELEIRELKRAGLRLTHRLVEDERTYRAALREFEPDLIISDFSMPHFDGMFALALARDLAPGVPFIFVSGTIGEEYAVRALKNGATDYVLKNNLVRLPAAVERALQEREERAARREAEAEIARQRAFLRQVIDLDPNFIFAKDREGRFTLVNQAVADAYGTTVEQLLGKTDADFNPNADEVEHFRRNDLEVMDTLHELFIPEEKITDATGKLRWLQTVKRAIVSGDRSANMLLGVATDITERKRNEEALKESESRLDLALQASELATWDWNIPSGEVRFSRHWWPILGYESQQIPLRLEAWERLTHPEDLGRVKLALREHVKGSALVLDVEYRMRARTGDWRWIRTVGRVVERDTTGWALRMTGTHGDVTDRKHQQEKIARLSRIQAVLSGINSAIVRIHDRKELFNEACRIAVEHGNFGIAWIGAYDPAAQEVIPMAWAGLEANEYLGGVKSSVREGTLQARGLLARAIKARKPVFSNDITKDPEAGGARRQEAIRRGYRSVIVLPLIADDAPLGTLSLFGKEPNFFTEEELKLLIELAGDISFALDHIAKEEKLEKLSRIRSVSSEINAAIVRLRERKALLGEVCRIAAEHGKFEMVWIGTVDNDKQRVAPVAWMGFSEETARAVSWSSISTAKGTLGEAIATRKPAVRNDIGAELPAGKLRLEALQRGCRSTICLPLQIDGNVAALIVLFATGAGFFDDGELALLDEVASNISFALESIARQEKLDRLSRIRAVLGEMNAAIVRIRGKQQLFEEACRIALEHGRFAMSWIGMLDEAAQAIRPVAKAGRDEGYLERLKLTIDPNVTRNLAMAVEAVGRSAPVICNDIATDGRMRPWRTAALERGYRSTVMLPLLVDRGAVGVFALYSPEPGFFDEEEMKLLVELAGDIAFALQTIEQQEKLDYLSYYDTLTGLPNRTLFHDRVNQALQAQRVSGGKAALLFLDLQRFALVNDTYGRQTGDALLKLVAERLESVLGSRDRLARIGADTFAIVLRDVKHEADVAHILEQGIFSTLGRAFEIGGVELRMSAKAGIALFPGDGNEAEALLRNADAALRKAKDSGDAYLFYGPQMNARVADQLRLENDLRNAIVHEQYVLHYQPRFDLASGQIVGMEALVRWKHPERGLVPPGEFIALLEETGMILDVGRWALRRAALEHAAWCAGGRLPPRIAVNVSPAQLRRRDFVDYVKDALAPVNRAAERIDLEITESMIMEDINGSIDKLKALQSLGLHVALDDFGTGYSSLSYLARLPINSLKIDRSFIMQMSKGPEQMAIVSTVISLARTLNLKVVAEGVETDEQANLLRLLRCDEAQGFLFSRPVPPEDLEGKLRQA